MTDQKLKDLEADFEKWIHYFFPSYAYATSAPFQIESSQRVLTAKGEFTAVRCWVRETGKTTRSFMEMAYMLYVQKKQNPLIVINVYPADFIDNKWRCMIIKNARLKAAYGTPKAITIVTVGMKLTGTPRDKGYFDVVVFEDIYCLELESIRFFKWLDEDIRSACSPNCIEIWNHPQLSPVANSSYQGQLLNADHISRVNLIEDELIWPSRISQIDIDRLRKAVGEKTFENEYMNARLTIIP